MDRPDGDSLPVRGPGGLGAAGGVGAHVPLLLAGGVALGLATADLAGPGAATAGWQLLPVPVVASVAGLATVVARPLRFAVLATSRWSRS